MKTIQLRRYTIREGMYREFMEWFTEVMPAVRTSSGFSVEFAYGIPESNEFIWAVSAPVAQEEFEEIVARYEASDLRQQTFENLPDRVASMQTDFIEIACDAQAPAFAREDTA